MKVLVLSGNGGFRRQVVTLMRDLPFTDHMPGHTLAIDESTSPREARDRVAAAAGGKEPYSLVVVTQSLSPLTGTQFAASLTETMGRALPPLVLGCENISKDLQKEAIRSGVTLFFTLPLKPGPLKEILSRICLQLIEEAEADRKKKIEKLMSRKKSADFVHDLENIYMGSFRRITALAEYAPWEPLPHLALSRIQVGRNRYADAIPYLKKALELDFSNSDAHRNLVLCYKRTGRAFQELEELEEMYAADPASPEVQLKLGDAYLREGDMEKAEDLFRKAIETRAKTGDQKMEAKSHVGLGRVFMYRAEDAEEESDGPNYRKAHKEFTEAATLDPTLISAYNNLILVYKKQGKYKEAKEVMDKAVKLMPEDAAGWLSLFEIFIADGETNKAAYALNQAIRFDPENQVTLCSAGEVYMRQKMFQEALSLFQKAKNVNPSDTRLYNYSGICYRRLEQYDSAVENYRKALEIDPGNHNIHFNLARAYKQAGREELAIDAFRSALEIEPDFPEARAELDFLENPGQDRRKASR